MTRRSPLSESEAWSLTDLVGASYVALSDVAAGAARPHDVTLVELVALAILAQHPDGLGQSRWGKLQGVSRQRAHTLTSELSRRGLVSRERHGRDSTVRFTHAGSDLVRRLRRDVGRQLASALRHMPASDAPVLARLLTLLLASVRRDDNGDDA